MVAYLDDRFHETGLDEASIHGTEIMLVDSSFEKELNEERYHGNMAASP